MALGLCVAVELPVCEVICAFHDFSIDGPIALSFWGIGAGSSDSDNNCALRARGFIERKWNAALLPSLRPTSLATAA